MLCIRILYSRSITSDVGDVKIPPIKEINLATVSLEVHFDDVACFSLAFLLCLGLIQNFGDAGHAWLVHRWYV